MKYIIAPRKYTTVIFVKRRATVRTLCLIQLKRSILIFNDHRWICNYLCTGES